MLGALLGIEILFQAKQKLYSIFEFGPGARRWIWFSEAARKYIFWRYLKVAQSHGRQSFARFRTEVGLS